MDSKVELLVPVCTWDALEVAIEAGADAVDLSGKFSWKQNDDSLGYFDTEQLLAAIEYAHTQKVKLYVSVNNLLSDNEIEEVAEYLTVLDKMNIDGIIIYDLAMLDLIQQMEFSFPIHVDVRMNIGNLEVIRYLQDRGVNRVVLSPNLSSDQIAQYRQEVGVEFECLIDGQLSQAQSGQCLHNEFLFESQHIRALLEVGVSCVKVADQTQDLQLLASLIRNYRQEIDFYYTDLDGYSPESVFDTNLDFDQQRELSIAWAYGDPWADCMDPNKSKDTDQLSTSDLEIDITDSVTLCLKEQLVQGLDGTEERVAAKVTVAVPTFEHFLAVLQAGAERILIDGDCYWPNQPWSYEEIATAIKLGYQFNCEVVYRTPRNVMEKEMNDLKKFFEVFRFYHLRIMTGDIGVIEALYGADLSFTLFGDVGLNAYNSRVFRYLKRQGFDSAIISLQAGVNEVCSIGRNRIIEVEVLAQGPIPWKGSDHHLALMPIMGELVRNGIGNFRIEGGFYSPEDLVEILKLYRKVIRFDYDLDITQEAFKKLQEICPVQLTYGPLVTISKRGYIHQVST